MAERITWNAQDGLWEGKLNDGRRVGILAKDYEQYRQQLINLGVSSVEFYLNDPHDWLANREEQITVVDSEK